MNERYFELAEENKKLKDEIKQLNQRIETAQSLYSASEEIGLEARDKRDEAIARAARAEKALRWYSEKAESIARYGKEGKHRAAEACLTELLIDGGVRACKALKGKK